MKLLNLKEILCLKKIFSFLLIFLGSINLCISPVFADKYPSYWTPSEDEKLQNGVCELGYDSWTKISKNFVPTHSPRQCRERWKYFFFDFADTTWTEEDDDRLESLYDTYGNNWGHIARFFPGKNAVTVKNRYKLLQVKIMERQKVCQRSNDMFWISVENDSKEYKLAVNEETSRIQALENEEEGFEPTIVPEPAKGISCDPLPFLF